MTLKIGALFAGYGGLDLAVSSVLDAEPVWFSEFDKGPSKILAHRFPGVPNHGDITKIDWAAVEPVDILTGGSPCQDLSHAGRRAGMTEGTRSNLWVAMREAIAALRPSLVVWENVRGAYSAEAASSGTVVTKRRAGRTDRSVVYEGGLLAHADGGPTLRALGRVLGDLSDLGYDARWCGLRAADVGSCHGRFRVFLVAHPNGEGRGGIGRLHAVGRDADGRDRADRLWAAGEPAALLPSRRTSDTNGAGRHGDGGLDLRTAVSMLPTPTTRDHKDHTIRREPHRPDDTDTLARALTDVPCALLPTPAVNDMGASYTPEEWDAWTDRMKAEHDVLAAGQSTEWGQYAAAIQRWESLTRPAPAPTETGPKGNPRLSAAFSEWMMGLPAGWVTEVPGITRNEALKALGNGVVPQQCAAALRYLLDLGEVAA